MPPFIGDGTPAFGQAARQVDEFAGLATSGQTRTEGSGVMSAVVATGAMSLDGYVSGPGESGFDHLFAWSPERGAVDAGSPAAARVDRCAPG
jgi:hypothetical protein